LHLGYLIDHTDNDRGNFLGSGFDLKSDAYGAVRAGQGLYVSTHPQSGTGSQPLAVNEAYGQLSSSGSLIGALSNDSVTHQAESLQEGQDALKTFTDASQSRKQGIAATSVQAAGGGSGSANGFSAALMLFASPSGIAAATQKSVHVAADQHVNLVSGGSTHIAAGKSLLVSVAEKISFFAQKGGMKLFAAKGKIDIQAQDDDIGVSAQKSVKLVSATATIEATAKEGILLTSGGAYIRIANGNIEIHAPGKVDIKGAQHSFSGPTSMSETYNREGKKADLRIRYVDADGAVPPGEPIRLAAGDGALHNLALDGEGKGELTNIDFGRLLAGQSKRS
jgi:type VI secretion system secreted protein VgrG